MKKTVSYILFIIIISISLAACGNKPTQETPNAVAVQEKAIITIDISSQPQQDDYTRHYLDVAKIEVIGDYIRHLTWNDLTDENPDTEKGTEYSVTYTYEDETTKTYYFKEDSYFKSENFEWKLIGNFEDFKNLVKNTDSD